MDRDRLRRLLERVQAGSLSLDNALRALTGFPFEDLGFARLDTHRALRRGFPETVYCPGKSAVQLQEIARALAGRHNTLLFTKANEDAFEVIRAVLPDAEYLHQALIVRRIEHRPELVGRALVLSAGTGDIQVAEEAAVTAETMGSRIIRHYDVGVAGLARVLALREEIEVARAIVVVAGMDAALPSVVAGLTRAPVIAVPTSVGYGASFGGVAPLLSMLNACAPGVAVVNIDNGYGAGHLAAVINRLPEGHGE